MCPGVKWRLCHPVFGTNISCWLWVRSRVHVALLTRRKFWLNHGVNIAIWLRRQIWLRRLPHTRMTSHQQYEGVCLGHNRCQTCGIFAPCKTPRRWCALEKCHQPPVTSGREENGLNFNFEWTVPLKPNSLFFWSRPPASLFLPICSLCLSFFCISCFSCRVLRPAFLWTHSDTV